MVTYQRQRPLKAATESPNVTVENQSLAFVKKLLAVSVSNITYLRGIFPKDAYVTRYLGDVRIRILKNDSCPGSVQLAKWILGCYDALQKKYLRMLILEVYTNSGKPKKITEGYHFQFKYTEEGVKMDFVSADQKIELQHPWEETKKTSTTLIQKLNILTRNLGPLPKNFGLNMKLFYYDSVTPQDYQPPGFRNGSCDEVRFEGFPMCLKMGAILAPCHTMKLMVTTEKNRIENNCNDTVSKEASEEPPRKRKVPRPLSDKPGDEVPNKHSKLKKSLTSSGGQGPTPQEEREASRGVSQHLTTPHSQAKENHPARATKKTQKKDLRKTELPSKTKENQRSQSCSVKAGTDCYTNSSHRQNREANPKRRRFSEPK
ncbi:HORMA domain-containing protein 1 isoform X2 [Tachyglossus aculeatus]|uniref:HORMA domain-containing protein 1 isoform X2 n=1 Tax=Tachyglossus aculeatus TaxID=9261 RepID=UPI0018F341AB|nr:HORMA domain-containing protein 1 isoform X2 [Tachyglossus aculeatus]